MSTLGIRRRVDILTLGSSYLNIVLTSVHYRYNAKRC